MYNFTLFTTKGTHRFTLTNDEYKDLNEIKSIKLSNKLSHDMLSFLKSNSDNSEYDIEMKLCQYDDPIFKFGFHVVIMTNEYFALMT